MAGPQKNQRIPREIIAYAYTPVCPVHRVAMVAYKWGETLVYFHCEADGNSCRQTDKAPKVRFVPNTDAR